MLCMRPTEIGTLKRPVFSGVLKGGISVVVHFYIPLVGDKIVLEGQHGKRFARHPSQRD